MTFRLTFNKPAAKNLIKSDENKHMRIKIEDGHVMFMASPEPQQDTAPLSARSRGGYEVTIEGTQRDKLLSLLTNPKGPFFTLRWDGDWMQAVPYTGKGAPPKFEEHVRVWAQDIPKVDKATPKTPKTKAVTQATENPIDRIRWAYEKLEENKNPRPGRPSNELHMAKMIAQQFEEEALSFVSKSARPSFHPSNISSVIDAYTSLGNFLEAVCPQAIKDQIEARQQRIEAKPTKAHVVIEPSSDEDDDETRSIKSSLARFGLLDDKSKKTTMVETA